MKKLLLSSAVALASMSGAALAGGHGVTLEFRNPGPDLGPVGTGAEVGLRFLGMQFVCAHEAGHRKSGIREYTVTRTSY